MYLHVCVSLYAMHVSKVGQKELEPFAKHFTNFNKNLFTRYKIYI